jgi:UDP-GlcNAc:undecaprenyl-phosphate/decaprenyl-phosphate GlcNAc-1-phosphate transferase
MIYNLLLAFFIPFITVMISTPFIIQFAKKFGFIDKPNVRKVHTHVMPRLGGLAIFLGVISGYLVTKMYEENITEISFSSLLIITLGILDDKYGLTPGIKLVSQIVAALIIVSSGLTIEFIQIPFMERVFLHEWSYLVTILWIVGITNTINLIDGLDGLAAGITIIVLLTFALLAFTNGNMLIFTLCLILLGSTTSFLLYNFHPAKIFMGDTGALFLGFAISVISLLGLYKSVTFFSFVVPIIILGVPIFDTIFTIIRRIKNNHPIMAPDKEHLHHRLMAIGFSHRQTVIIMYFISIIFSLTAIVFSTTILFGTILLFIVLMLLIKLLKDTKKVYLKYKNFLILYCRIFGRE